MSYGASYEEYLNMDVRTMYHFIEAYIQKQEYDLNTELNMQVRLASKVSQAIFGDKRNFGKVDPIKLSHVSIEEDSIDKIRAERKRKTLESLAKLGVI